MTQKGIDTAQAELSVFTLRDDDSESATGKQGSSCHSSMANSGTGIHDYVNVTTVSGPQSLSTGFPSLSLAEFHIKVCTNLSNTSFITVREVKSSFVVVFS